MINPKETYAPGQASVMLPWLTGCSWFLLGGPADGDEAFTVKTAFSGIKIAGFEPNPAFYALQQARGFPGLLLPCALWESDCRLTLRTVNGESNQAQRSASVAKFADVPHTGLDVPARSLDSLDGEHGFTGSVALWLDVEGAELAALRGAAGLLPRVKAVNIEVFREDEGEVRKAMDAAGLRQARRWGFNGDETNGRYWWNVVYVRG